MACPKRLIRCRSQTHKKIVPRISLQYIYTLAFNTFATNVFNTLCGASTWQGIDQHYITCWVCIPMLPVQDDVDLVCDTLCMTLSDTVTLCMTLCDTVTL